MKAPVRNLKKVIHRARSTQLPPNPVTLQFALDIDWLKADFAGDIELIGNLAVLDSSFLFFSHKILRELLDPTSIAFHW